MAHTGPCLLLRNGSFLLLHDGVSGLLLDIKMSQVTITGTVTDTSGASGNYSVAITVVPLDAVTATATVSPDPAPVGTLRTLTILATSSTGLPLTYNLPVSAGIIFTVVTGAPNKFTFKV